MNTRLVITPDAKDGCGIEVQLTGYNGQATLHWGDGTTPMHTLPNRTYRHVYPSAGSYMVTALDGGGVLIARQQIVVRGSLELDEVRVSDDDGGLRVTFGEIDSRVPVVPSYRIEWPDGDREYTWGVPGRSVRHDCVPGTHDVKVVDTSSGRTQTYRITVEAGTRFEPDFVVYRQSHDRSGMTVCVRLKRVKHYPIHIWWDDADGPQLVEHPRNGMEIPHTYTYPGHYMQTVAYAGETTFVRAKSEAITVPAGRRKVRNERLDGFSSLPSPGSGSLHSWFGSRRNPGDFGLRRALSPGDRQLAAGEVEFEPAELVGESPTVIHESHDDRDGS